METIKNYAQMNKEELLHEAFRLSEMLSALSDAGVKMFDEEKNYEERKKSFVEGYGEAAVAEYPVGLGMFQEMWYYAEELKMGIADYEKDLKK